MQPLNAEVSESHVAGLTSAFVKAAEAARERAKDEEHVKKLTATDIERQTPNTARNLVRVVRGKDNDPVLVARALKELQRFRQYDEVEAIFVEVEREERARIVRQRILALKNGGFLKKAEKDRRRS